MYTYCFCSQVIPLKCISKLGAVNGHFCPISKWIFDNGGQSAAADRTRAPSLLGLSCFSPIVFEHGMKFWAISTHHDVTSRIPRPFIKFTCAFCASELAGMEQSPCIKRNSEPFPVEGNATPMRPFVVGELNISLFGVCVQIETDNMSIQILIPKCLYFD